MNLKITNTMVQTFLVEETTELIHEGDKLQEWKEKCEVLGLSEQLALASPDKSPIPFQAMDEISKRVYETLCPAREDYKTYKKTAIPLEVLGLIHLSVNEGYFKGIEIWYDDKSPDPLAVGYTQTSEYGSREYFIVARWGDVLRHFEELRQLAIERFRGLCRTKIKQNINDLNNRLSAVDSSCESYFIDTTTSRYDVLGTW